MKKNKLKEVEWEVGLAGNAIADYPDFYLSYRGIGNYQIYGQNVHFPAEETVICIDGNYRILNGDHREELKKVADKEGLKGCIKYYNDHPNDQSSWSTI